MEDEINGSPVPDSAGEMSIADSLRAAFATADTDTNTETTTESDPAIRDDGRDPRGRFAPKKQPETTVTDPAAEVSAAPAEPAAPEAPAAVPAAEAPQHWAAQDKELFGKLPPDGQKFLLDRHKAMEGDYTRRMQEIAPLRKAAEQWQPYLQQIGASPEQAFQALIGAEYTLRSGTPEQKAQALQKLAQDYRIPLNQQTAQPAATDEYVDPQVVALNQKLAQLEAWKNSREQAEEQSRRQQQERQQSDLQATITTFETEKTEAGESAHPHFSAVKETMAALIGSNQAPDLKTAYDMAVWARPDLRQQLLTAQQDAAVRKAAEEAKARAQKASTAAASITGSPAGATPAAPAKSVREELERAWASARA